MTKWKAAPGSLHLTPALSAASRVILVLMVALALSGCGRKGNPQPPPGEPNAYPRTYPSS
ncbi:MAG TPA: lipoprotein [Stellaceae bacterium]|nr:lipoprotein [Stellaceae bacterium]